MADKIVQGIVDKLYGGEPETYTLDAEHIKNLRALVKQWSTTSGGYGWDEVEAAYENGKDSAYESARDDLTDILPFLR